MALDKEYFDSIRIDVVRRKYYDVSKVDAVFSDIRRQAEELMEENADLRSRLRRQEDSRAALGEAVYSAQEVYRMIVDKAHERAAQILAEAEAARRSALIESERRSDYAFQLVENCMRMVREQQAAALETVDSAWQSYLCGLYPETDTDGSPEEAPADLHEKVGAIARELEALED